MGMYKYLRESWKNPSDAVSQLWKSRLEEWRKSDATVRVEKPIRLDRARSLGYKAKPGFLVVRQRIIRGGRMRTRPGGGRRSKHSGQRKDLLINYQVVCEQR